METIKITFLESSPDGLRKLTTDNWSGVGLVVAREHFAATQTNEELMRPGVYILVGPSRVDENFDPPRLISKIYIGKSDMLDERLRSHSELREFWSTAFAFYRAGEELHAGQIAQLEALLIEKARAAKKHDVLNVATPRQLSKPSQLESISTFAGQIESMLKALGYDFFSSLPSLAPESPQVQEREVVVPSQLSAIVESLCEICAALPATEVYKTKVPDVRAKVVSKKDSRVFARIEFRSRAVKLTLKDGSSIILTAESGVPDSVADEIRKSRQLALSHIS